MRLIGIKLNNGDDFVIKNLKSNHWYPFGNYIEPTAQNGWRWFKEGENLHEEDCNEMYRTILNSDIAEGIKITVNCIVGKNGSGKSTLLDILYRIINNFAYKLLDCQWKENQPDNNPQRGHQLAEAEGFDAELYYEADDAVGSIRYYYGQYSFSYHSENENTRIEKANLEKIYGTADLRKILRHFFYTIGANYSIHSLNCDDYKPNRLWLEKKNYKFDGNWLKGLYHKNDGYITPLVMTPFRDEHGTIDIGREKELAKQRLSTLAVLFASQGKSFMDYYKPNRIVYRYNHDSEKKYNKRFNDLYHEWLPLNKDCSKVKRSIKSVWKQELRNGESQISWYNLHEDVRNAILSYLAYKTLKTCLYYRKYGELLGLYLRQDKENEKKEGIPRYLYLSYAKERIEKVISEILHIDADLHVNQKIHQILHFVRNGAYNIQDIDIPIDGDANIDNPQLGWNIKPVENLYTTIDKYGKKTQVGMKTYEEVFVKMPPAIFEWDIDFIKKGDKSGNTETLSTMSSGEKQMMQSFSYILYHIKNLQSVTDDQYRIRYHNITLVFDEAELYYHPEYQREFISKLIQMLSWCHMDGRGIRGINILIVTHSPFVLSDVPLQHTLYLDNGEKTEKDKQTFGGNIHELLGENFFMDYSIGEVARTNIEEIIQLYNERDNHENKKINEQKFQKNRQRYYYILSIIADEYLNKMIGRMLRECESQYLLRDDKRRAIEREIQQKREELAQLESTLKQMNAEL